jgi:hypothetical protein
MLRDETDSRAHEILLIANGKLMCESLMAVSNSVSVQFEERPRDDRDTQSRLSYHPGS